MKNRAIFGRAKAGGIVLVLAAWSGLAARGADARACSCAFRPPALYVDELFDDARAVFVGAPYAVRPVVDARGFVQTVYVDFEVYESWKGVSGSRVGVVTSGDEASCGVDFQVGRTYLVFAFSSDNHLAANLCAVKDSWAAEDELGRLGDGSFDAVMLTEGDDPDFPPVAERSSEYHESGQPVAATICGAGLPMMMLLLTCFCGFRSGHMRRAS